MTCKLQLGPNILAESQDNGADGGDGSEEGPVQEAHGNDVNYKMMLVVAPCKTDMPYKMLWVVTLYKTDLVVISTTRWWWLPARQAYLLS